MGRPQKDNDERNQAYEDWLADPNTFEYAEFKCFIDPNSMKHTKEGALVVGLIVPPGQVDKALCLRYLIRDRLPLIVEINVDTIYRDLQADQARHLALLKDLEDENDGETDGENDDETEFNGGED